MANATIKIRINGSWNAEDPLYVIDGFIRDAEAFNLLDPSEVDNISVLKDAAAAVYGVRGAGGVILVTTKRGKESKTTINYSGSVGFSQGINMPEMMSAYEQGRALNDMWNEQRYNGETVDLNNFTFDELNEMRGLNYNWLDDAWKTALNTRHTLNVSGGTEKIRYFVGGSYLYSNGNFSDLDMNRVSMRSGLDVNFTKEFKGSFNVSYSSKQTDMPLNSKDAEADLMYGTFSDLNRMPRWIPAYIDGKPVGNGMTGSDTHPLEIFNSNSFKTSKSDDIALSAKFDYNIKWVKGLNANISLNYSKNSSNGKQLTKPYNVYNFGYRTYTVDGEDINGHLLSDVLESSTKLTNGDGYYDSASFNYSYQINPQVNYHATFGRHDVSALYVFELAESGSNYLSVSSSEMQIDNYENLGAYNPSNITGKSGKNNVTRRLSHIGRLNYSYGDKYFFEGTLRYEASSNFAPEYRWGLFYSLSGSWRVSEEKWFKDNVKHVDNLKLRASYGRLGNDKVSLKQWRQSYEAKSDVYLFGEGNGTRFIGFNPAMGGLTAYNSSWEKSDSYNVGLDLRLKNGIYFDVDGFYKHTFDILDEAKSEFPQSSGVSGTTPKLNYGILNAWGGELGVGYQKQFKKDWAINIKGNFSYAANKVIKKYQNPGIAGTWQDEEGRMGGGKTGYKVWRGIDGKGDGLARTWDDVHNYVNYLKSYSADGIISVCGVKEDKLRPGMVMYEDRGKTITDQTPDGIINSDGDYCIISKYDSAPFNYGLTLGLTWKDFSISALFNGSFGNDIIYDKGFYTAASGGKRSGDFLSLTSNQLREWYGNYAVSNEDGTLVNPNAKYPRLDSNSLRGERSDYWMRDGHCLRLRTLSVSYTVPQKVIKTAWLNSCRVFFTANNIWTIVNPYPYKDAYVGFWSDYPQIRTFNFGINVTL